MSGELPGTLKNGADNLLEGFSRKELASRSNRLSEHYRAGGASRSVVANRADVIAYVFSRLPATYAAVWTVLGEVRFVGGGFTPASLLDVGAGPGAASWAAVEAWPEVQSVTMLDCNSHFLNIAGELASGSEHEGLKKHKRILADFTRPAPPLPAADLVIASFALVELAEQDVTAAVTALWNACRGLLILVEPGTSASFARVRSARETLIQLNANLFAPCPHATQCPIVAPDWCHFVKRVARSRDHMIAKGATVPFEDEKFSYVAAGRMAPTKLAGNPRILTPPQTTKADMRFRVCTAEGIVEKIVLKRDRHALAQVRRLRWGDSLPGEPINPQS